MNLSELDKLSVALFKGCQMYKDDSVWYFNMDNVPLTDRYPLKEIFNENNWEKVSDKKIKFDCDDMEDFFNED